MSNLSIVSTNHLVFTSNNDLHTDSIIVARYFSKRHNDVIRRIESLLADIPHHFGCAHFSVHPYKNDQNGETYTKYEMTKDGFMLLVMGFTGKKASLMKVSFIEAFNDMERQLNVIPANQFSDDELHDLAWLWRCSTVMIQRIENVYPMLKAADHIEAPSFYSMKSEYQHILKRNQAILANATQHITPKSHNDEWCVPLRYLRADSLPMDSLNYLADYRVSTRPNI